MEHIIKLRRRSLVGRIIRVPVLFVGHYRVMRRDRSTKPWTRARLAWKLTAVMFAG
jgi:hypothetical protein